MAQIAFLSLYSGVVDRGVETFVLEISKRLKSKHQITIFQGGPAIHEQGIRSYQTNGKISVPSSTKGFFGKFYLNKQSLRVLLFTLQIAPELIRKKFDLIIPLNGGWQVFFIRFLTKITGTKMLVSGHAGIGSDDACNIFLRPDVFVALTTAQQSWAKSIIGEIRVEKIPNGVDLSKFNPNIKAQKINLKRPIVVCASALVAYKRIDLTIRAIAKTKYLSLLLLGEGQMHGYLDSLGKRMLKDRYLRINPPYQKMPAYYRTGRVFTLASNTEAFGISYLEAMASNLPVVTTCDSSRQEIIGNAGILTDPVNINQYAKDLLIAAKTDYKNIPYDQALKFSWNKIAKQYSKLINEITKS